LGDYGEVSASFENGVFKGSLTGPVSATSKKTVQSVYYGSSNSDRPWNSVSFEAVNNSQRASS
jgi:hypothetical protein